MGRRARSGGITGAALRAAQRTLSEQDEQASRIAQYTYEECVRWKREDGHPFLAPVAVSAKLLAPALADAAGVPASTQNLDDIASFLTARFWETALTLDPESVREFTEEADARLARRFSGTDSS